MHEIVIVALMVVVAFAIIYSVMQSGYFSVKLPELSNARISVVKHFGDCMPPVTRIPCCDTTVMHDFALAIDGENYKTDSFGDAYAKLSNGTHVIAYQGCYGPENMTVYVSGNLIQYGKTSVQRNGVVGVENATSRERVEINMNCCTY